MRNFMIKQTNQPANICSSCGNDSLQTQIDALRDLIEVAKTVVSTLDLDTLLQAIMVSAMHYAEAPAGSVALYDSQKKELTLHAHHGLSAEFIKAEKWSVTKGGMTEQILNSGEIFIIRDTEQSPFFNNPIAISEGIRSLVSVPLVFQNEIVGILYLDDFVPRDFNRSKLELLSILASFAALAIHNARLHNKTKLMAITDFLTGLYNHRYFQQMLTQELGRARRYQKVISLIILDIDNFKSFNDRFGHAVGDKVLIAIGDIISRSLRKVDYAFRYGGEEFVILLPETSLENAILTAERLRVRIADEAADLVSESVGSKITVSAGVACYPENGSNREDLFSLMDSYLYKAKSMGKNQVCHSFSENC
jgi:diguanylate cyclase (GGDEF)-like protein